MIKFENTEVNGFKYIIRGARSKYSSKFSDSYFGKSDDFTVLGPNDYQLLLKTNKDLFNMIVVYVDITAPLYFWKEFDKYNVNAISDDCVLLDKINNEKFKMSDFSTDHLNDLSNNYVELMVGTLNSYREMFLLYKDKEIWYQITQMLPSSFNQKRTVMISYKTLIDIYKENSILDEWKEFHKWIKNLPYSETYIINNKY